MSQNDQKHSFKKPLPKVISTEKRPARPETPKPVQKEVTPVVKTVLSEQVSDQLSRLGQPQGVGVYQKPKPTPLKKEPSKYVAEDIEHSLEVPRGFRIPKIINISVLAIILILILFVFNQFTSLFVLLSKSPTWYRYTGYFFLSLLALLLVYSLLSFLGFIIKLNRFDQQSLSELSNRALTIDSTEFMQDTITKLKQFIEDYKIDRRILSDSEFDRLSRVKQQLLHDEYGDSLAWLEEYKYKFQKVLDDKSNEVVALYAKKVGWNTAIVPNGFLDALVVFYLNLQMIKSLSVLYHVRINRWSSLKLFSMIFIHTFGARQLEEMTETMLEHATEHIFEGASHFFTKKLGSKVSEGVINYYFTNRIGKRCIHYLQPLTK